MPDMTSCRNGDRRRPLAPLAQHLTSLRQAAQLTQREVAGAAHISRGAVQRAESGLAAPTREVLDAYLSACRAGDTDQDRAWELWARGRAAQRGRLRGLEILAPLSAVDEEGLGVHLARVYEQAGAPCLTRGDARLPRTSAWRISRGKCLPATRGQLVTFLTACGVLPVEQRRYIDAYQRVVAQRGARRVPPRRQHPRGTDAGDRGDLRAVLPALHTVGEAASAVGHDYDWDAIAPALEVIGKALASWSWLADRTARRNGAAAPDRATTAYSFNQELHRVLAETRADSPFDFLMRTGDGRTIVVETKTTYRGRPGPGTALSGGRGPAPRPAPAAHARTH
jgi:transcriptional regulator with XRE-family HTH domain